MAGIYKDQATGADLDRVPELIEELSATKEDDGE